MMNRLHEDDFDAWMRRVGYVVRIRPGGFGPDDFPDQPYRAWFDAGLTEKEAAQEVLDAGI